MRLAQARIGAGADFGRLWFGESVSLIGAQVALLALPLTVLEILHASVREVGLLNAMTFIPFTGALLVGVWIDRVRRRHAMIGSNVIRAGVLLTLPLLAWSGQLRLELVYGAALVLGACSVIFDVAYQSYLPSLVGPAELVRANSRMEGSAALAQVAGPGAAGILVDLLTAPIALVANGLSYLVSLWSLLLIRRPEAPPVAREHRGNLWRDIGDGLRLTFTNNLLRACLGQAATYNMCWLAQQTVFLPYATERLGMTPSLLGLVMGSGAVGSVGGAVVAGRLAHRWGHGPAILAATLLSGAAPVLLPVVHDQRPVGLGLMIVSFFLGGAGLSIANVHMVSLRQAVTPQETLGRVNASYRFVAWGVMPVGALAGGFLADAAGLRVALVVIAGAFLSAPLWILFSKVPRLRSLDAAARPDQPVPVEPGMVYAAAARYDDQPGG
ncbi:MFS transporter [Catellatospora tritici]|uniref:MFS transporter n=1 Tax=Catellatospora tritici TaxID=2851566 RepID=UPI001C2DCF02|nr:MFS transporter [Catellatospora tritici]MBV1855002.1 MFS transporter [Catellatospora tritici]